MNDDNYSQSSSSRGLEWDELKEFTCVTELDEAILTKIPYNIIRSSHSRTNCNLKVVCKLDRHKIHQEKRICKGHTFMEGNEEVHLPCPVQYKVFRCGDCSCYKLLQNNQHSVDCDDIIHDNDLIHPESHVFGIHPKVKLILNDLIEKNLLYLKPTQAHIYLNLADVSNGEMKGLPMPDRNQVKYYLRAYRNSNHVFSNKVEDVKHLVKGHLFSHEINEDTPFFFGYDFDEFNEPILGNGDNPSNAFRIGITSKKLINRIPSLLLRNLVFHLDCTYKLTKNRFPFMVFGFSDLSGQFHPIAFALVSHESTKEFEWFFGSLNNLFLSCGIVFNPVYVMMDSCDASYNAVKLYFPNCIVLMCFFHIQSNIKKNSKFYPMEHQGEILNDSKRLNSCTSYDEFCLLKDEILNKWESMGLDEFKKYFIKQWLSERWWRWQLLQVIQGWPTTNSCIESYNKIVKLLYTNYISYTVLEMLKIVMDKIVTYSSKQPKEIKYYRAPECDTITRSKEIDRKLFVRNSNDKSYIYDNMYYLVYDANLIYHRHIFCSCTCKDYHRTYICKHVLALAGLQKLKIKGYSHDELFATRSKPGKKKAISNPLSYD